MQSEEPDQQKCSQQPKFRKNQFIDLLSHGSTEPTIRIIDSIGENGIVRLKDLWSSSIISENIDKGHIHLFRSFTKCGYNMHHFMQTPNDWGPEVQRTLLELDKVPLLLKPKQIVQLVRGKYYFFISQMMMILRIKSTDQIRLISLCYETHMKFIIHYLTFVDFKKHDPQKSYQSQENAFASCYPELMENLIQIIGLNKNTKLHNSIRQYQQTLRIVSNLANTINVNFLKTNEWIDNQLLPTLLSMHTNNMPVDFISMLCQLLVGLVKADIVHPSQPLSTLFEALYKQQMINLQLKVIKLVEISKFEEYHEIIIGMIINSKQNLKVEILKFKLSYLQALRRSHLTKPMLRYFLKNINPTLSNEVGSDCYSQILKWIKTQGNTFLYELLNEQYCDLVRSIVMKLVIPLRTQIINGLLMNNKNCMLISLLPKLDENSLLSIVKYYESNLNHRNAFQYFDTLVQIQKFLPSSLIEMNTQCILKVIQKSTHYSSAQVQYISQNSQSTVLCQYFSSIIKDLKGKTNNLKQIVLGVYSKTRDFTCEQLQDLLQSLPQAENNSQIHSLFDKRINIINIQFNRMAKDRRKDLIHCTLIFMKVCNIIKKSKINQSSNNKHSLLYFVLNNLQSIGVIEMINEMAVCENLLNLLLPLENDFQVYFYLKLVRQINLLQGNISITQNKQFQIRKTITNLNLIQDILFINNIGVQCKKKVINQIQKYNQLFIDFNVFQNAVINFLNYLIIKKPPYYELYSIITHSHYRNSFFFSNQISRTYGLKINQCHNQAIIIHVHRLNGPEYLLEHKYDRLIKQLFAFPSKLQCRHSLQSSLWHLLEDIAGKWQRQPDSFKLLFNGTLVSSQELKMKIGQFLNVKNHRLDRIGGHIVFQVQFIKNYIPSLTKILLQRISHLFELLPYSLQLWSAFGFNQITSFPSTYFKPLLQPINYFLKNTHLLPQNITLEQSKMDFILNILVQLPTIDPQINYSRTLCPQLIYPHSELHFSRNTKIIYLIYKNKEYPLIKDCHQIMDNLIINDISDEEADYLYKKGSYQLCLSMAFEIFHTLCNNKNHSKQKKLCDKNDSLQKCSNCNEALKFLFTLQCIIDCQQSIILNEKLLSFWIYVYQLLSLSQKQHLLFHFSSDLKAHPQNWIYFAKNLQHFIHAQDKHIYKAMMQDSVHSIIAAKVQPYYHISFIAKLLQNDVKHISIFNGNLWQCLIQMIYRYPNSDCVLVVMYYCMENEQIHEQFCKFVEVEISEVAWESHEILRRNKRRGHSSPGLIGLKNPHSICYMNSFLQQLFHCNEFRQQLLSTSWKHQEQHNSEETEDLIYQLKKIFLNLQMGNQSYINPDFFKAFKDLDGESTSTNVQMDVDEFKSILFDRMEKLLPDGNNFIKRLFNGLQQTTIRSQQCGHQSSRQEQFSSLCLDVKDFNCLQDSLTSYFKPQILEGENAYHCEQCNKKVKAEKHIEISQYPLHMIFVLKRFEYLVYRRSKINSKFQFPLNNFTLGNNADYQLKGIIIHQGISEAGHYISLIRKGQIWYEFNDAYVESINEENIPDLAYGQHQNKQYSYMNKNAYLLFYDRIQHNQQQKQKPTKFLAYKGVQQQYKRIIKAINLVNKEKLYFQNTFLTTLIAICEYYKRPSAYHLLLRVLCQIYFKLINHQEKDFNNSLRMIFTNRTSFPQLWQVVGKGSLFHLILHVLRNKQMAMKNKSFLIGLMADNYNPSHNIEQVLNVVLRFLYDEQIDNASLYQLMLALSKKNQAVCQYLLEKRLIGRILDLTFVGYIGEQFRDQLKHNCSVEFEFCDPPFKFSKQLQKKQFRYYKWKLLLFCLKHPKLKLQEVELDIINNHQNNIFKVIFQECSSKANTNAISAFLCYMSSLNNEYSNCLITFIEDNLVRRNSSSDILSKYFRVLKGLLKVQDNRQEDRCKAIVGSFARTLTKIYDQRTENTFDLAWQWFIKIARKNVLFKNKVRERAVQFTCLQRITLNYFSPYRYKENLKLQKMKKKYHDFKFATNQIQAKEYFCQKKQITMAILHNRGLVQNLQGQDADSDADLTQENLKQKDKIMKFCEVNQRYEIKTIVFAYADFIIIESLQKSHDGHICMNLHQGHEGLIPWKQYYQCSEHTEVIHDDNSIN